MTVGFEDHLRGELHASLDPGPGPRRRWDEVASAGRRSQRRARRRRLGLASVVAIAAVVVALVAVARPSDDPVRVDSGPSSEPVPATTPTPTRVAVETTTGLGTDQVSDVLATPDGAWVALWGTGEVIRVDTGGAVTARIPIGTVQNGPLALADGEGAIWVLDFSTGDLVRIDALTAHITGRLHLPAEPERVAVGNGKVWVTACCDRNVPNQRLYRIDPRTLTIEHELALPGQGESEQVGVNANGVYIAGERFTTVVHVDPAGTRILAQADVGDTSGTDRNPCQLVVGVGTGVWCAVGSTGKVAIIDPQDKATLVPAPATISSAAALGDSLVVTTDAGLFQLGEGWIPWGGPPAAGPLDIGPSAAHRLWVAQGSQLLQLSHP